MKKLGIVAVVWVAVSSFPIAAAGGQQSAYSGTSDFQTYCTSCHGTEGKGDGLIAKSLPKRPPDLTKISARHDGAFPREQIFKTIEGRSGAHTNVDMPVWADVFAKSQNSLGNDAAAARIEALVEYLVTLQDKK